MREPPETPGPPPVATPGGENGLQPVTLASVAQMHVDGFTTWCDTPATGGTYDEQFEKAARQCIVHAGLLAEDVKALLAALATAEQGAADARAERDEARREANHHGFVAARAKGDRDKAERERDVAVNVSESLRVRAGALEAALGEMLRVGESPIDGRTVHLSQHGHKACRDLARSALTPPGATA